MKREALRVILIACLVVLLGSSMSWARNLVHVKAAPSGPTVTTTSTNWEMIPNLRTFFVAEDAGNACINVSGEFFATSGRMFLRATIDGTATAPSDVVLDKDFGGTSSFNFTVNVAEGPHEACIEWTVDSGATASVGDRTMWIATAPEIINTVAVPSGPDISTTSGTFVDIPNLGLNIQVPEDGDVFVSLTAESNTSADDKRMFVKALIDGTEASPTDVVFAKEAGLALHAFTFVKHLTTGIHPLNMQWVVDPGGTAFMGDRTVTIGFSKPSDLAAGLGGLVSTSAPSGPSVSTTSSTFSDIPDMSTSINVPENASLVALFTGEAEATAGKRMFVRALIDGEVTSPSDVVFVANSFYGARSMSFVKKNLAAGNRQVRMQWLVDSGGTAFMGDRNLTVIVLPTKNHFGTGWWYDSAEPGTGVAADIQGDRMFAGWYNFNSPGQPIWYTSGGSMTDVNTYSGTLYQWTGWPLGTTYAAPVASGVGTWSFEFMSANEAQMSWNVAGSSGSKTLTRFMDDLAPGDPHPLQVTGWYYDPAFDGMGIFVEAQGGGLFGSWYHFGDVGIPRWWSSGGSFPDISNIYTGTYDQWADGQCIGCPYTEPIISSNPSPVTITFFGGSQATMIWSGGTLNLQRFNFDNL